MFLWPLVTKELSNVCDGFAVFFMAYGPIRIFQFNNGIEFKGALLYLLRRYGIRIINGNPRHPQIQRVVERANGTIKDRINNWMEINKTSRWVSGLVEVYIVYNLTKYASTQMLPYQVHFGRSPVINDEIWLDPEKRKTVTFINEDGEPEDDKASINLNANIQNTPGVSFDVPEFHILILPILTRVQQRLGLELEQLALSQRHLDYNIGRDAINFLIYIEERRNILQMKKAFNNKAKSKQPEKRIPPSS